ncbi:MAG: aldehyde:ferredoxin oxidoreductase [Planctomycetes bacterium]|nr:aldehyde:ferredoxin oxidoreductase [Planctomycetota bacterium]
MIYAEDVAIGVFDLTASAMRAAEVPAGVRRAVLGGRGLSMLLLWKLLPRVTGPFDPDNPVIFAPGVLTGSSAPSSARFNVSAKSPETMALGDSNAGGTLGASLAGLGWDALAFTGRAAETSVAHVSRDGVRLHPMPDLRLAEVGAAQETLRKRFGDADLAVIGPAGERLVRMAGIVHKRKSMAARGGLGAVMGSKNLKAVVVDRADAASEADAGAARERARGLMKRLLNSPTVRALGDWGTGILYDFTNRMGALRTRNAQAAEFDAALDAADFKEAYPRRGTCHGCPVGCRHVSLKGDGMPEFAAVGALGSSLGIRDAESVSRLTHLCDAAGLDASSTGAVIAWAIELSERGLLAPDRPLRFGDPDTAASLIADIAARRGLGDALAESSRAPFPAPALDFLIAVKGAPQTDPVDVRGIKSFALALAVSSRGADHLRSRPTLDLFNLPEAKRREIYGIETDPDVRSYRTKEVMVAYHEDVYALIDALGLCRFVTHGFNSAELIGISDMRGLVREVRGLEMSEVELRAAGRRIVNLERLINAREGLGRADDTLPPRYFDEPVPSGDFAGERIDRREFAAMLSRYYALRGWDDAGRVPADVRSEIEGLAGALRFRRAIPVL